MFSEVGEPHSVYLIHIFMANHRPQLSEQENRDRRPYHLTGKGGPN